MIYVYVAFILLCETTAISFLKEYSKIKHAKFFVLGVLLYGGVSYFLIQSFAFEGLGMVNVMWSAFSLISVAAVGVMEFRERMTHMEMLAMSLSIVGIVILRF